MKTSYFLVIALILAAACKKDENIEITKFSENTVNKTILQTYTQSLATGMGNLFTVGLTDSVSQAHFSQNFCDAARFFDDESGYVFVETMSGFNIAHPIHPKLEGQSSLQQTDANGTKITPIMINTVRNMGYGWLRYPYLNPATEQIEEKYTFVNKIPQSEWYAGSGYYEKKAEQLYTENQKNEALVKTIVNGFALGIGAVIHPLADSMDRVELMRDFLRYIRFFEDQSGYLFVLDFKGFNVVQPPDPSIQGTYEWNVQDAAGNFLVRGLIETAQNGGGFYSYLWEDYQTGLQKQKTAYVIQIPGTTYLIGSGIYAPE